MKICVIGLGHIGLPTAAMFASAGNSVLGVDKDPFVIDILGKGKSTVNEEGMNELVQEVVNNGSLRFSLTPEKSDVFIIAVPTPITATKQPDMSCVLSATSEIVPHLRRCNTVILESTSPVGTVDKLMVPILEKSGLTAGIDFYLGHSPERVIPGQILNELTKNSRISGGINEISAKKIADIYKIFVKGEIHLTDAKTAELCKLVENTYRDINIAFANELAKICENSKINVWEAISLCNKHPRVNIHQPGPGVGGHCIAVDPWFLIDNQPEIAQMMRLARSINDSMPSHVTDLIDRILSNVKEPVVTIFGLTYKPDVNDMRESPVIHLIEILKRKGYKVRSFDPHAEGIGDIEKNMTKAAEGSDLLVLCVHHSLFRNLPFSELGNVMRTKNYLDTRNFIPSKTAESAGFQSFLLGYR